MVYDIETKHIRQLTSKMAGYMESIQINLVKEADQAKVLKQLEEEILLLNISKEKSYLSLEIINCFNHLMKEFVLEKEVWNELILEVNTPKRLSHMDTDKRQSMFICGDSDEKRRKDQHLCEEMEKPEILTLDKLP